MKPIAILFAVIGSITVAANSQAQYCCAGVFNNWNASANPMTAGPNAGEFSFTITGGTPGAYDQCKVTDGTWNNSWPGSGNLEFLYDSTGSATIHFWPGSFTDGWLPTSNRVGYDDPDNDPGWGLPGDFNSYNGTANVLSPIGNGVYSNSFVVATAGSFGFKFQSPPGNWSDINFANPDFGNNDGNGSYLTTQTNQTLPAVLDLPGGRFYVGALALPPTNYVTFQLDLSEEVALGNFVNGASGNSVAVGGFNADWGTDNQLTNYTVLNPGDLNPGLKTNLYIGTFATEGYDPISFQWKFRVNNLDGGYEQPVSTAGGNRSTTLTQQNTVLPVTSYDDLGLGDLTINSITINFSVLVTNGTPDDTGYQFVKGSDQVFINGAWLGWPAWGVDALPPNQQMMEVGNSDVYTNSFVIPRGTSIYMTYKYSFNGVDDENGGGTNHIREVRSYGPSYTFPQDVWSWDILQPAAGNPYPLAGVAVTNIVEPDFGNLHIGGPSAGAYPLTWLGRPAVLLQNAPGVNGPWNTLTGTDGTESTNWTSAGAMQFFRLMKE
ncbi:MAG TPA: hypothetical protein VH280_22120 [Verrucomicrobiae bacterium]|jgi:hypothetical protein|nr:hypothetical protein [Verrucomicrobiae bacterium]